METNRIISELYSCLGTHCLNGDVKAIKYLYGNSFYEKAPVIETINLLRLHIRPVEINADTNRGFNNEFLYYLGMIFIGESSHLIVRDLDLAEACFEKIVTDVPKAAARLAFINLLLSENPHGADENIHNADVLRTWVAKGDYFSAITFSKIVFEHFLRENRANDMEIPTLAFNLLNMPCRKGHPEAIRFYNMLMDYTASLGTPDTRCVKISGSQVDINVLYDF